MRVIFPLVGRGRRSRARRTRRKRGAAPPTTFPAGRQVEIFLDRAELARGHDGALRGSPEPCFVFGAYWIGGEHVTLLAREIIRVGTVSRFPVRLGLDRELVRRRVFASSSDEKPTIAVIAIALEEDSGADVGSVFSELETPERLSFWNPRASMPEPKSLLELARSAGARPAVEPVVILRDDQPRAAAKNDEWVGALMLRLSPDPSSPPAEYRFPFSSADAKNDWTAVLRVRVGR